MQDLLATLNLSTSLLTSSANKITKFGFDSLIFCGDPETWLITSTANSTARHS